MTRTATPARQVGELLTAATVAERLHVTAKTLRNWRYLGGGPPYVKPNGRALYPAAALDAWLADRLVA